MIPVLPHHAALILDEVLPFKLDDVEAAIAHTIYLYNKITQSVCKR